MDSQQKAYPTDISFSNASTICQTIVSKQSDFRLNKNKVGEQIKRARNFGKMMGLANKKGSQLATLWSGTPN
ncbi:hypothetical protein J7I04_002447 [Vibrio parahaemolyticus]|nr:hypothetical protein [Vibrio parahaemolyticus]